MKYSDTNKPLVCMMTNSTCYKGTGTGTPVGVLWHDTAASNKYIKRYVQPYKGDANYSELIQKLGKNDYNNDWNHLSVQAGLNAWIGALDDNSIATVQTLPWNYRPWGCGSGPKGSCNGKNGGNFWIQFEICDDGYKSKEYFDKVYKEACEFTAYICKEFGIDPNGTVAYNGVNVPTILCHKDSYNFGLGSNHGDVYLWFDKFGKTMEDVRKDVAKLIGTSVNTGSTSTSTSTSTNTSSSSVNGEIYRIRKSWGSAASQVGAYRNLDGAKDECDRAGDGYFVYDESGNVVYPKNESLMVGDVVKLSSGAKYTSGKSVPTWVINSKIYVREIRGDDIVISVLQIGAITGVVNKKYLTKNGQAISTGATQAVKKSINEIAKEVIQGKWGSGTTRKKKLEAAGYDYNAVQKEVNRLLS